MKKNIFYLIILLSAFLLAGCARLSQVRPTSFALNSLSPRGMRALVLDVSVGVHNPATEIALSEISGEVVLSGKVLGNVTVDPVLLAAKTDSTYRIKADVALADGVSFMEVMAIAGKKNSLDEALVNLYAKAKVKGAPSKQIRIENMPLKKLIESLNR